ncbi:MAG: hypothetical protein ABIO44_00555, partial [Saprospiraceae bacterium]
MKTLLTTTLNLLICIQCIGQPTKYFVDFTPIGYYSYEGNCNNINVTINPIGLQEPYEDIDFYIDYKTTKELLFLNLGTIQSTRYYDNSGKPEGYKLYGTSFFNNIDLTWEQFSFSFKVLTKDIYPLYASYYDKLASEQNYYYREGANFKDLNKLYVSGLLSDNIAQFKLTKPELSSISPQKFKIIGKLIIDVPEYHLLGQCNVGIPPGPGYAHVSMDPGAEIVVNPGSVLYITNNYIQSCSNERWKSITLLPGAYLISENSTFDNAHIAVDAKAGSLVIINDCHFLDPYIGIDAIEPGVILNVTGDCKFRFDGTFNSSYPGEPTLEGNKSLAGIRIQNGMTSCIKGTSTKFPYFDGLQYGILAQNTDLEVTRVKFLNLNSGISQFGFWGGGVGIASRSDNQNNVLNVTGFGKNERINFNHCTVGILNRGNKTIVKDNNMSDIYLCIDHKDTRSDCEISSNRLVANHVGIDLAYNKGTNGNIHHNDIITVDNDDAIGINQTRDYKYWLITKNLFESNKGQFGFNRLATIGSGSNIVENTFKMNNSVRNNYTALKNDGTGTTNIMCNYFESSNRNIDAYGLLNNTSPSIYLYCNQFDNYRYSTGFVNGNLGTLLRGTTYSSGYNGLVLGNQSSGTGIIGDQIHNGNVFERNYTSNDAICWGGSFIAQQSQFFVNSQQNEKFLPINPNPGNDWFKPNLNNTSNLICLTQCPNGIGRIPKLLGYQNSETQILSHSVPYSDYNEEQNWNLKYQIYELLQSGEFMYNGNSIINNFKQIMDTEEEGLINTIESGLASINNLNSIPSLSDLQTQLNIKTEELSLLISTNITNLTLVQLQIQTSRSEIQTIQQNIYTALQFLINSEKDVINTFYNSLSSESNSALLPKKNLHRVLFLELKHLNGLKLSQLEELDLISIAQTCPKQGGKASFIASALIYRIYNNNIIPENNCTNNVQALKV